MQILSGIITLVSIFLLSTPTPVSEDTHSNYLKHVAQASVLPGRLLSSASGLSTHGITNRTTEFSSLPAFECFISNVDFAYCLKRY